MATLKSLAEELGVSIGTVSLALNNSPRIQPKTARRVWELARKRHYAPNNFGRALQSGHSKLIGCLTGSLLGSFFDELIEGMGHCASKAGYGMMISLGLEQGISSFVDQMLMHQVEGIIFTGGHNAFAEIAEMLTVRSIPFVFCSTQRFMQYPTVVNDDFASGVLAAECLLQHGHCNFLIEQTTSIERIHGVLSILEGKAHYHFFENTHEVPEAIRSSGASAVIAFSDLTAADVLYCLRQSGLRVPEDVSIIGHDNLPLFDRLEFKLTTINVQRLAIGKLAADYIIRTSQGEELPKNIMLKPEVLIRNTVQDFQANH